MMVLEANLLILQGKRMPLLLLGSNWEVALFTKHSCYLYKSPFESLTFHAMTTAVILSSATNHRSSLCMASRSLLKDDES